MKQGRPTDYTPEDEVRYSYIGSDIYKRAQKKKNETFRRMVDRMPVAKEKIFANDKSINNGCW